MKRLLIVNPDSPPGIHSLLLFFLQPSAWPLHASESAVPVWQVVYVLHDCREYLRSNLQSSHRFP